MTLWIPTGIGLVSVVAISSALIKMAAGLPQVTIATTPMGLSSVKSNNVEFLQSGEFKVEQIVLKKKNGETHAGTTYGSSGFDQERRELTMTFPWGIVRTNYAASNNELRLAITTTNTSDLETIEGVRYTALVLRFPEKV